MTRRDDFRARAVAQALVGSALAVASAGSGAGAAHANEAARSGVGEGVAPDTRQVAQSSLPPPPVQPVPPPNAPGPPPRPEAIELDALERTTVEAFSARGREGLMLVSLADLRARSEARTPLPRPEACPDVVLWMADDASGMQAAVTPYPTLAESLSERFGEPMCLYWVTYFAPPPPGFLGRALVDGHRIVQARAVVSAAWQGSLS